MKSKSGLKNWKGLCLTAVFFLFAAFSFSKHSIPLDEIHSGGPPKDGIPALFDPVFIPAAKAGYLQPEDRVLGISLNGEAKAYPIRILNWHELVNDHVGGEQVLVSYCPLCGTGMIFNASINGKRFLFGVSGKLYNSDVLFYDKETESLWSQIKMEAVTGAMTGTKLKFLFAENTTWEAWKMKNPDTKVLSLDTGFDRDYSRNPYQGYGKTQKIYFPVSHEDSRLARKDWVLGTILNGHVKAYPFEELRQYPDPGPIQDTLGGEIIFIFYDPRSQSAFVTDNAGKDIPSVQAYWFAWAAFYPNTKLWSIGGNISEESVRPRG